MVATTTRQNAAPDWAAIVIVILSVTAFAVAQGLTFPLISLALEARGVAGRLIGLNAATYAAGAIVSVLTIDRLTARVRGNRLIVAALFGCSIGLAAFAMTDSLPIWFIARFAIGFCASLISILLSRQASAWACLRSRYWSCSSAHDVPTEHFGTMSIAGSSYL
ncbi:hypothetical protein MIC97_19360 [Aquamicrobium sp. NLF2-7]|uniref:hypothetical protein n=1 Tax=Aquamicrobium sp. NLF2-7 TaxID=2918753 RepID=UPI001EFAD131|nr:hypothetical protein [Aquamicrobium sp. NLF2-7]MCG8273646.1 hypothetical protein [Aquamicrobium sp. NLF2-7]